jgi:hypothetical protein
LSLTSTAPTSPSSARTDPYNQFPASPGQIWSAGVSVRAGTTPRMVAARLVWYNAAGGIISSTAPPTVPPDSVSAWLAVSVTGIAPALTAFVGLEVKSEDGTAVNEVHYVDSAFLRLGDNTAWSEGGQAMYQQRYVTVAVQDAIGEPVSGGVKTDVDEYLQSHREINFVVNVIDPTYTAIDVTFQAVAFEEQAIASVQESAIQAIRDYLAPINWARPTTGDRKEWLPGYTAVRYLELATVLNQVGGLNYVTNLTLGVAGQTQSQNDIQLGGWAPMPRAGNIVGTILAP